MNFDDVGGSQRDTTIALGAASSFSSEEGAAATTSTTSSAAGYDVVSGVSGVSGVTGVSETKRVDDGVGGGGVCGIGGSRRVEEVEEVEEVEVGCVVVPFFFANTHPKMELIKKNTQATIVVPVCHRNGSFPILKSAIITSENQVNENREKTRAEQFVKIENVYIR